MVYSCAPVNIAPPDVASWSDSNIDGRLRLFFLQRHTIYILTKKKKKKKKKRRYQMFHFNFVFVKKYSKSELWNRIDRN